MSDVKYELKGYLRTDGKIAARDSSFLFFDDRVEIYKASMAKQVGTRAFGSLGTLISAMTKTNTSKGPDLTLYYNDIIKIKEYNKMLEKGVLIEMKDGLEAKLTGTRKDLYSQAEALITKANPKVKIEEKD